MQRVPTRDTCSVARKLRLELPWQAVEKDGCKTADNCGLLGSSALIPAPWGDTNERSPNGTGLKNSGDGCIGSSGAADGRRLAAETVHGEG